MFKDLTLRQFVGINISFAYTTDMQNKIKPADFNYIANILHSA